MNQWIRVARAAGSALFLAGLLAGCGGSGGSGHINVFFGINGSGDCNGVLLDIDLHGANAALSDPIEDCVLDSLLQLEGCEVRFWKIERGDILRVTVSECEIPATSSLFQCGFDDIDLARLANSVEARCLCQTQSCDSTPPVCADLDPSPASCEDCDNGFDDDGNFLTDCADPNCQYADACDDGSTTTTTTTLPGANIWSVVFRLAANVSVGSLQFEVDYGATGGSLVGQGPNVECRSLIDGALIAFNDNDAQQTLTIGLISIAGFTGPIDAVECKIQAAEEPAASDFVFSNVELSSPDSEPIPASPSSMGVGAIEFVSGTSTTTSTIITEPTSTTIGEPTTTTLPEDTTTTTEPPPTTTTTTLPANNYAVQFSVTTASAGSIGALQWATNYSTATGGFQGSGGAVACTSPISGLFAPNDLDATKELTLGVISFTGFAAPTTLATCTFNGDSGDPPVAGDFVITIQDATDVDGAAITATIAVTTITPLP